MKATVLFTFPDSALRMAMDAGNTPVHLKPMLREIVESLPAVVDTDCYESLLKCLLYAAGRHMAAEIRVLHAILTTPTASPYTLRIETYHSMMTASTEFLVSVDLTPLRTAAAPDNSDIGKPIAAPVEPRRPTLGGMSMRRRRG